MLAWGLKPGAFCPLTSGDLEELGAEPWSSILLVWMLDVGMRSQVGKQ